MSDEAVSEFDKALETDPDTYRAHYWKSLVYAKKGEMEKSRSEYNVGVSHYDQDLEVRYDWANELAAMGRYHDAIDEYKKILEYQNFSDVRVKLGIALIKSGRKKPG